MVALAPLEELFEAGLELVGIVDKLDADALVPVGPRREVDNLPGALQFEVEPGQNQGEGDELVLSRCWR